jgi:hypothetical protein
VVVNIGAEVQPSTWMTNTVYLYWSDMEPLVAEAEHHVQAYPFHYYYLPIIVKNYSTP